MAEQETQPETEQQAEPKAEETTPEEGVQTAEEREQARRDELAKRHELVILEPEQVRLELVDGSHLKARLGEEEHAEVSIRQGFPLTAPNQYVAVLNKEGKELGIIPDSTKLDQSSQEALTSFFDTAYFEVRISRVLSVRANFGITTWKMTTDRGERSLVVRDRSDIRKLPPDRMLFTDIEGMRYLVDDYSRLDARSQMLIEEYT
jgi:hypothetical protein